MADFDLLQSASTLPLFVCLPADGFRFLFVSEAARAAFGHSREALMRLRHRQDAHFPLPTIDEYWHRLLQNEAVRVETRLGTENGHSASVTIRFERLIHADQAFLLGHFCEPVQPPAIEQQLAEARLTAQRALQVRDRFLTHMSHELRTPLSGIIGLSHLARDTESLILARDYFRQIHHSGERLLTTLSDILDFCQIETGTMILHPVSFNPGVLIQEIIQVVKTEALDKRLTLLIRVEPELPAYLIGDAQRLRQVLLNLVGNAVKFTRRVRFQFRLNRNATNRTVKYGFASASVTQAPAFIRTITPVCSRHLNNWIHPTIGIIRAAAWDWPWLGTWSN